MTYSPIIDFLANQPLQALVKPADDQHDTDRTACFCPFCKQQKVAINSLATPNGISLPTGEGRGGASTPHFIIYNNQFGGLYSGKGAQRWMCTRTHREGYGALELYAAIHNMSLEGESLRRAALGLLQQLGFQEDDVRKKFPYEHPYDRQLIINEEREQDTFTWVPMADITPQAVRSLGCEVWQDRGVIHISFGDDFSTMRLFNDFRTLPVTSCTLPTVTRNGERLTQTVYGTPYTPLFITFATSDMKTGVIWNTNDKAINQTPPLGAGGLVFSLTDDHTISKISRWLGGDKTLMYAIEHRDSATTAVWRAVRGMKEDGRTPVIPRDEEEQNERLHDEREEWVECEDRDGMPNGKFRKETVEIPKIEQKAKNIIYCDSPYDAICAYYTLRQRRLQHPENDTIQNECWYHTAFLLGRGVFYYLDRGTWAKSEVDFGSRQFNRLARFAQNVICFFPNTRQAQQRAYGIVRKYRDILLASFPANYATDINLKQTWLYAHRPDGIRDFMLAYKMSPADAYDYNHDYVYFFHKLCTAACCTRPLLQQQKRDRNNAVKETYYTVNPATIWKFMQCEGYARAIDPNSEDEVGEYIRRDGVKVKRIDRDSMVLATKEALRAYARKEAQNNDDYALMLTGIDRATKEVNIQTITALPAEVLKYQYTTANENYHFFKNGALRVTPTERRLMPYSSLTFDINPEIILCHSYNQPTYQVPPIMLVDNPEVKKREEQLAAMPFAQQADGSPTYTRTEITQAKRDFKEWRKLHAFTMLINGKPLSELSTFNSELSTFNIQHSTSNSPLSTFNIQHSTSNSPHSTSNIQHSTFNIQLSTTLPPIWQTIYGMCNPYWAEQEDAERGGEPLTTDQQAEITSRFANFVFCIGQMAWGYKGKLNNVMVYLMENSVENENQASGGSGKSTIVNIFLSATNRVFNVDCKKYTDNDKLKFAYAKYDPTVHSVLHFEDTQKTFSIKIPYNITTTGIEKEKKGVDADRLSLADSPVVAISSNYPPSDTDDSTERRMVRMLFSNRFCGDNDTTGQVGRTISEVFPRFSTFIIGSKDDEEMKVWRDSDVSQIADFVTYCEQFVMNHPYPIYAPNEQSKRRGLVRETGEQFVNYAEDFFADEHNYGILIDLTSCFNDYVQDYTETSNAVRDNYAKSRFRDNMLAYCVRNGIQMNPVQIMPAKGKKVAKYVKLTTWKIQRYFDDQAFRTVGILPKRIREKGPTQTGVVFYRRQDKIPEDYAAFRRIQEQYISGDDPYPILDEDGTPVRLTDNERLRWQSFTARKGVSDRPQYQAAQATPQPSQDPFTQAANSPNLDDVPF